MRDDEVYGPCIFCGAPWNPPADIDHRSDCASITGLYPVLDQDFGPRVVCEKCHHVNRWPGFGCCVCRHQFSLGEFYVKRPINDLGPGGVAIVCLTCEALGLPIPEDAPK